MQLKRPLLDVALHGLCPLLTIAVLLVSAGGGEAILVCLLCGFLSLGMMITGGLLAVYRYRTQRALMPAITAPSVCLAMILSVAVTQWRIGCAPAR